MSCPLSFQPPRAFGSRKVPLAWPPLAEVATSRPQPGSLSGGPVQFELPCFTTGTGAACGSHASAHSLLMSSGLRSALVLTATQPVLSLPNLKCVCGHRLCLQGAGPQGRTSVKTFSSAQVSAGRQAGSRPLSGQPLGAQRPPGTVGGTQTGGPALCRRFRIQAGARPR